MVCQTRAHTHEDAESRGHQESELEIVATIMTQIPKEYEVATQAIRTKPSAERKIELVKNVYWEFWHSNLKNSDAKEKTAQQENVALYTNDAKTQGNQGKKPWRKYKGNCSWCGIQGHKAVNCRKRQVAEHKDGTKVLEAQKKCYQCKNIGHIARNCPDCMNKTSNAFFVRMCEDETEMAACPSCGRIGMAGTECKDCKGVVYENEVDKAPQPSKDNEEAEGEDDDAEDAPNAQ